MNSVSVQIQRAINDAISNQVLPQIQNVILAGSGRATRKGWDVPTERPEINSEVQRNLNAKNNLRNEQDESHQSGDFPSHNVHVTGVTLPTNSVPSDRIYNIDYIAFRFVFNDFIDQSSSTFQKLN